MGGASVSKEHRQLIELLKRAERALEDEEEEGYAQPLSSNVEKSEHHHNPLKKKAAKEREKDEKIQQFLNEERAELDGKHVEPSPALTNVHHPQEEKKKSDSNFTKLAKKLFKRVDKDKTGYLNHSQAKEFFGLVYEYVNPLIKTNGFAFDPSVPKEEIVEKWIKVFDINHDDKIYFDAFLLSLRTLSDATHVETMESNTLLVETFKFEFYVSQAFSRIAHKVELPVATQQLTPKELEEIVPLELRTLGVEVVLDGFHGSGLRSLLKAYGKWDARAEHDSAVHLHEHKHGHEQGHEHIHMKTHAKDSHEQVSGHSTSGHSTSGHSTSGHHPEHSHSHPEHSHSNPEHSHSNPEHSHNHQEKHPEHSHTHHGQHPEHTPSDHHEKHAHPLPKDSSQMQTKQIHRDIYRVGARIPIKLFLYPFRDNPPENYLPPVHGVPFLWDLWIFVFDLTVPLDQTKLGLIHARIQAVNLLFEQVRTPAAILFVGNKLESKEHRVVTTKEGRDLADKYGGMYVEMCASSGLFVAKGFDMAIMNAVSYRKTQKEMKKHHH